MNNKTLALLALSFFVSGCTQIIPIPSEPADTEEASVIVVQAVAEPEESAAEIIQSQEPVQDYDISVAEETGSELSTIIVDRDSVPEEDNSAAGADEPVVDTAEAERQQLQAETQQRSVQALCQEIGNKLGSVSVEDCLRQSLQYGGGYTVQSRPIVVRDFLPDTGSTEKKTPRILIMGGIHGDEYSSISIMFRWMEQLERSNNRDFYWRFAPSVNPDGLLDGQAIRQNANGVDLNRNFPSDDWLDLAQEYWVNTTNRNPRRFPGSHPASEPEVQWVVEQINSFKPDVIVSVHAPYHLLDYDGPPEPPQNIGELHLHLLGVYPGSLGNYAGVNLGIPVVTMELPSAGIMPKDELIRVMWNDLLEWLYKHHES